MLQTSRKSVSSISFKCPKTFSSLCPPPFTYNIRLFKSFKSQLFTIHTGLLCPLVQAGLCPRDTVTRGPRCQHQQYGGRSLCLAMGSVKGQRSGVGQERLYCDRLFCQQLCNKTGRDRDSSITSECPGGDMGSVSSSNGEDRPEGLRPGGADRVGEGRECDNLVVRSLLSTR